MRTVPIALLVALVLSAASLADETPLRIAPRSENSSVDLWGAKVGADGWIKFELPGDLSGYKDAILLLHVDDIDAPEEVDLLVNEKVTLPWAKSMIGEGERGGAIPIDVAALQPARNYFHFIFKSNLNNTTSGFGIKSAELQLFKDLSEARKARILREAASFGKPLDWTEAKVRQGAPLPAPERTPPAIADRFQDEPLSRWKARGGDWCVSNAIDLYGLEERTIYESPEEPGWVEWVGLWKEKSGDIKTCFAQITGNPGLEPSYRPWYGRGKSDEAWQQFCKEHKMRIGPEDAVSSTKGEYPTLVSHDQGDTWENLGPDQKPRGPNLRFVYADDGTLVNHGIANLRCRDGRIVSTAWNQEYKTKSYEQVLCAVRESIDNGKTWTETQWITPEGIDPVLLAETSEESAMVELDDGRILMVMRCDPGGPCQTYLTRVGPGQYEATPPTRLPMPHSGMPELVRGADGVIWNWQIDGHWYTEDDGATWHKAPFRFWSYYGKMLEAAPNQILCLTQYLIHDSPYPYWNDASIRMYRFAWRRTGIMEQDDDEAPLALLTRPDPTLDDLHLCADVRVDGVTGLAFRVRDDGKAFYCLAVALPGSPEYERWSAAPAVEQEVVAANYNAEDMRMIATGDPMLVIARVEDGKTSVLRGMRLPHLPRGSWVRLQVKVTGGLIQGAINTDPATYVGARDSALTSGKVGLVTDESTGAFKNFEIWNTPQMIRDNWRGK